MLAALVVLLRTLRLLFSGHRAVALENMALRQQLSVLRRTVRRPHLRTRYRLFWVLLAKAWRDWRTAVPTEKPVPVDAVDLARDQGIGFSAIMSVVIALLLTLRSCARSRAVLQLELLAVRHQLHVLQRTRPRRLALFRTDRWLWVAVAGMDRLATSARHRETRNGDRMAPPRLSVVLEMEEPAHRPPAVSADVRVLIRTMSEMNPRWGAPRIHGELLKLGIEISQSTVAKYLVRHRRPPSPTWRTFLANHIGQIVAADFFVVPTATGRLLFVLLILAHERRRIVHVAATDHPTAAWTSQQLREAFPWDGAPRYLVRDRDHAFANWAITAKAIGIEEILTAPRSPWQNAYVERLIGSVRRECLDHVIVFSAIGLQRLMRIYCAYYEQSRTHLSLNKDAPIPRRIAGPSDGRVVAIPQVGGLHHRYERQAA